MRMTKSDSEQDRDDEPQSPAPDDERDDDERDDDEHDDAERDDDERDDDEHDDDEHDDDERDDDEHDDAERDDDEHDDEAPESAKAPAHAERYWGHLVKPTLVFIAALCLLNAMVNARYPLDEPALWYLIPSTDTAIILLNFAIMGLLGNSVPRWLLIAVTVWIFLVRLLRFGDGIQGRYFAQRFNVYTDLQLVPDGFRFLHSTRPIWQIVGGSILLVVALAGLAYLTYRALVVTQNYLQQRRAIVIAAGLVGVTYFVTSQTSHSRKYDPFFSGGFAASSLPRLQEEAMFFWNVRGQASAYAKLIAETQDMLKGLPSDLAKLGGANVYLILVESYGRATFEWPPLMEATSRTFDTFEQDVKAHGFHLATGLLNSTTYGGQSWLAHATLDTGIPTRGQLEFEIVLAKKPLAIGTFFRRAGYRTVLVQPNTTRAWTHGDFYDFEAKYVNKDFRYRGPAYAWATMPDQFVLDFVRRREIAPSKRPLFIQYVLVSSHAPWSKLPTVVDDWNSIGDGSIFHRTRMERFPIEWPNFDNATEAYTRSIVYDFEVLRRYVTEFIDDGSLVIILGDHQPVAEVNGETWEMGVPIHVLSKNPEFVRPFVTRGYRPGVRPNLDGYAQGLETLFPSLLVDFSTERVAK
jgi:hypothetical protein